MDDREFTKLIKYLVRVPALPESIGRGTDDDGHWWVKFEIDIDDELAWQLVQELGWVMNDLSLEERRSVFQQLVCRSHHRRTWTAALGSS